MKQALALAVALLGVALAGGREPGPIMPMNHTVGSGAELMQAQMTTMLAPLRPLSGQAFDVNWTKRMIDHHQMAVEMAQHELMMGKDARVKAAAQKVVDAQMTEIATMKGWLVAWTGKSYVPQPMPMGMDNVGSMDRWFLESMIPHHQGAIDMAKLALTRTENAELLKLAQSIIKTQSAEIALYQGLLKAVK